MLNVQQLDWGGLHAKADEWLQVLFPICRSITGNGVRETLQILQKEIDLTISEIPSGTRCYDWSVPDE